jgi:hypothetical protein
MIFKDKSYYIRKFKEFLGMLVGSALIVLTIMFMIIMA